MFNFDYITKEDIKEHNPNWPEIPDHPYRILIVGGSGSGKTNALLNLINHEPDIDKIYLYAKDPYEAKYQFLINKRESTGLKHFNDSKAFIEYSNDMDDIYKNIEEYNPNKKRKILIVFDDMIADMLSNKNLNPIVTKLFIRGRKLNIFLVFITQSYFAVPKIIRLNSTHYFIVKIPNFNKSHLIIHQILTFRTLWNFIKSVLENHILIWFLILHLHQIVLHVLERIFQKKYKSQSR